MTCVKKSFSLQTEGPWSQQTFNIQAMWVSTKREKIMREQEIESIHGVSSYQEAKCRNESYL